VQPRLLLLNIASLALIAALPATPRSFAADQPPDLAPSVPPWLLAHVGDGDGQIAPVVLQRARALYLSKLRAGAVSNPCYFAMDATRPHDSGSGELGRRFYIICEADRTFRAVSAGHGGGRNLSGLPDFANGVRCAKNFGNAMDSKLTTGGPYTTAETTTSFKGYYRDGAGKQAILIRSFVQFDGEGEAANARPRAIGGHPSVVLKGICRRKEPDSTYADKDGYVRFGTLVEYTGGRSNGCTSWSPQEAAKIIPMVQDKQTTLYIYPEAADIAAVAKAVKSGHALQRGSPYWNASCLKEIGVPKFWAKETLEPLLAQYAKAHPAPPPQPPPLCK
jgi:hypothetical protein